MSWLNERWEAPLGVWGAVGILKIQNSKFKDLKIQRFKDLRIRQFEDLKI